MQHYKRVGSGVNNITFSFDPAPLPSDSQLADGKTKKVQAKITLARPPKLNIFHRDRWKCNEKRSIFFLIIMVELYGGWIKNFVSLFCISESTEGENPEGNEQEEEDDEGTILLLLHPQKNIMLQLKQF